MSMDFKVKKEEQIYCYFAKRVRNLSLFLEKPDILCLNEHMLLGNKLEPIKEELKDFFEK